MSFKNKEERKRNYHKLDLFIGDRHMKKWNESEILSLNLNITDREICKLIGRSVQSIQIKRSRINQPHRDI